MGEGEEEEMGREGRCGKGVRGGEMWEMDEVRRGVRGCATGWMTTSGVPEATA